MAAMNEIKHLKEIYENNDTVRLFLMNGFQKEGKIVELGDDYIIFRDSRLRKNELVWKHAISTFS